MEPSLEILNRNKSRFRKLLSEESTDILLVWPFPESAEELCEHTIPSLLHKVVDLSEEVKQIRKESLFQIITLSKPRTYQPAIFRSLGALVKSFQKDIRWIQFSYYHLDTLNPDIKYYLRRFWGDI